MDLEAQLFHPFIHSGCQLELSMHHFKTGKKIVSSIAPVLPANAISFCIAVSNLPPGELHHVIGEAFFFN